MRVYGGSSAGGEWGLYGARYDGVECVCGCSSLVYFACFCNATAGLYDAACSAGMGGAGGSAAGCAKGAAEAYVDAGSAAVKEYEDDGVAEFV